MLNSSSVSKYSDEVAREGREVSVTRVIVQIVRLWLPSFHQEFHALVSTDDDHQGQACPLFFFYDGFRHPGTVCARLRTAGAGARRSELPESSRHGGLVVLQMKLKRVGQEASIAICNYL